MTFQEWLVSLGFENSHPITIKNFEDAYYTGFSAGIKYMAGKSKPLGDMDNTDH